MPETPLKARLAAGETVFGSFLTLGSPLAAEALGLAGFDWLLVDLELTPDGKVPGLHVHPEQTETFRVVEGRMRFRLGRRTVEAGPGDVVTVPPGAAHKFTNAGGQVARAKVEVRPALQMEQMFAEVVAMAKAGRMTKRGLPRNPLDLATLARTYDNEAHAPLLSVGVQRALLAPLVMWARHPRMGTAVAALAGVATLAG